MDLRLAVYALARQYRLDASSTGQLWDMAGIEQEPAQLARRFARGVAVLGAGLGGLGGLLWVAANWSGLGRFGRFGLLEIFFLIVCAGAILKPGARSALSLLALLCIGGVFAYFGQTYQTGADPWQLFALWSVLALPLCLGLRNDVLWAPWMLVTVTGVSLWVHAHAGHSWAYTSSDVHFYATGWYAMLGLTLLSSPLLTRFTGAGPWSFRCAVTLATFAITATALGALFDNQSGALYWIALLLLTVAGAALASKQMFEIYGLSAIALALNILLVFGVGNVMAHNFDMGSLLLIGLFAAGMLAATVKLLLHLSARQQTAQVAA